MLALTLSEIADLVDGVVVDGDPSVLVTAPARFDSRLIEPGGLFVALRGEHADGHEFAAQAVRGGATGVLAARPVGVPAVVVDDVQVAFAALARGIAQRLTATTIVGVTGSAGKTTTKDILGTVLGRIGPTVVPVGSRNNELGFPETITLASADTRFLVVEMGARHLGDIRHLTGLARPSIGVVLNVGTAHLGEFGSVERIAEAKGELVEALTPEGLAVLNADDPLVSAMAARTRARVVTFGRSPTAEVRAVDVAVDPMGRAAFTLCHAGSRARVNLRLHGEHLVSNALAAAAVAMAHTSDLDLIADALSSDLEVSRGRMGLVERPDGVTIINDAYNANPDSMAAALRTLATMTTGGRRGVAVLGEMAELGDGSAEAHRMVGKLVGQGRVSRLVAVGSADAAALADEARRQGVPTDLVDGPEEAARMVERGLRTGDVVLVKGSNSTGLLSVAARLADSRS